MENELPEVSGINVINVSQDLSPEEIKEFMDNWIDEHPHITSDPGQIVIFSPYEMIYELTEKDGINYLNLTGYMSRTKWATLSDADDLRSFAFQLEKNHANLKVNVILALSVKEFSETDESYNFVDSYFAHNREVHEMITQMHLDEMKQNEELNEDLDSELFGEK